MVGTIVQRHDAVYYGITRQYTMEPSHYIELPKNIAEKLVTSRTKAE